MMNIKRMILMAMVLLSTVSYAQNEDRRVSIEPYAGLTISKMDGNAIKGNKSWKTGWTAGAEVEIPLSNYYSITTGADYSLIGTNIKMYEDKYMKTKVKLNDSYINIPVQLKMYFRSIPDLAFHMGADVGFLVSAKAHGKGTSIKTMDIGNGQSSLFLWEQYTVRDDEDVSSKFRNIIFSIPVGLSYEWKNVELNATYRFEVRKAISYYEYPSSMMAYQDAITARNHAIHITLGYKFKL